MADFKKLKVRLWTLEGKRMSASAGASNPLVKLLSGTFQQSSWNGSEVEFEVRKDATEIAISVSGEGISKVAVVFYETENWLGSYPLCKLKMENEQFVVDLLLSSVYLPPAGNHSINERKILPFPKPTTRSPRLQDHIWTTPDAPGSQMQYYLLLPCQKIFVPSKSFAGVANDGTVRALGRIWNCPIDRSKIEAKIRILEWSPEFAGPRMCIGAWVGSTVAERFDWDASLPTDIAIYLGTPTYEHDGYSKDHYPWRGAYPYSQIVNSDNLLVQRYIENPLSYLNNNYYLVPQFLASRQLASVARKSNLIICSIPNPPGIVDQIWTTAMIDRLAIELFVWALRFGPTYHRNQDLEQTVSAHRMPLKHLRFVKKHSREIKITLIASSGGFANTYHLLSGQNRSEFAKSFLASFSVPKAYSSDFPFNTELPQLSETRYSLWDVDPAIADKTRPPIMDYDQVLLRWLSKSSKHRLFSYRTSHGAARSFSKGVCVTF